MKNYFCLVNVNDLTTQIFLLLLAIYFAILALFSLPILDTNKPSENINSDIVQLAPILSNSFIPSLNLVVTTCILHCQFFLWLYLWCYLIVMGLSFISYSSPINFPFSAQVTCSLFSNTDMICHKWLLITPAVY